MIKKIFVLALFLFSLARLNIAESGTSETERIKKLEERLKKLERLEKSKYRKGEKEIIAYYKNGFKMRTRDDQFRFQVGGRIQHDWGLFSESHIFKSAIGQQENGSRFRRVRFFMAGLLNKIMKFKFDIDVGDGSNGVAFKDMYLGIIRIPVLGNLQVGHFKRPASIDSLTSSNYLTFIERSLANTFFKTRNTGFSVYNNALNKRLNWAIFINKETSENPPEFRMDGDWNITSRISGAPYYSDDGKRWIHLGISWSHEKSTKNKITFNGARDTEITNTLISTGIIPSRKFDIIGLEGAFNWNQLSFQGEYAFTDVNRDGPTNGQLDSFYIQGTWYLTGENRHYSPKKGVITRFKPKENFDWKKNWSKGKGLGAFQLAARYSELDLNDRSAGINGGEQKSLTLGLNWELNRMSRIMYNYVHADFTSGTGTDNGILASNIIRFQIEW
tara:strand:- start:204 stop:1538 length:1335 start_codon:yes stop_codon:yes gene_type:complete